LHGISGFQFLLHFATFQERNFDKLAYYLHELVLVNIIRKIVWAVKKAYPFLK